MRRFLVDLHVHTALSPCASQEMTPPAIVREAIRLGLHLIAVCDHNSTANTEAVRQAAGKNLAVLAGIEITTSEEIHILGIFPDPQSAGSAGDRIAQTLPEMKNESRKFTDQPVMDSSGKTLRLEERMLSFASGFNLSQTIDLIKKYNGLAIASHIDRPAFGLLSQLGIFPPDLAIDAVEVTPAGLASSQAPLYTSFNLPIVTGSDSHYLTDLGTIYSMFEMDAPTFDEIALTLRGVGARRIRNSA